MGIKVSGQEMEINRMLMRGKKGTRGRKGGRGRKAVLKAQGWCHSDLIIFKRLRSNSSVFSIDSVYPVRST